MWYDDDQLMRVLGSTDARERCSVLTLLRNHRAQLESFATRHTALFFRALRDVLVRTDECNDVKRWAWRVLTTVVSLHAKPLTAHMVRDAHMFTLALDTVRGVTGRDQGTGCVADVLAFVLALHHDGVALYEIDVSVVSSLAALPGRLGQGLDRFGYALVLELLRALQNTDRTECAEAVDDHVASTMDSIELPVALILVANVLETCRAYCAVPVALTATSSSAVAGQHARWSGLSSVRLEVLLTETTQVLCIAQSDSQRVTSLDKVVALKWLLANSAALSHTFVAAHDVVGALQRIVSATDSTHTTQRLASELLAALPTGDASNSAACEIEQSDTQCSLSTPLSSSPVALATQQHELLEGPSSESDCKRFASSKVLATWRRTIASGNETATQAAIAAALRAVADPQLSHDAREQIWATLAAPASTAGLALQGTSMPCALVYYDLMRAAFAVVVDARADCTLERIAQSATELLVGALWPIFIDDVDRNGAVWHVQSALAAAAAIDVLALWLERAAATGSDSDDTSAARAWQALRRWLLRSADAPMSATTESTVCIERVVEAVTRALEASARAVNVIPHVLQVVHVLTQRFTDVVPLEERVRWIESILQSATPAVRTASFLSLRTAIDCVKSIAGSNAVCRCAVDASAPKLAREATAVGSTTLAFVARLAAPLSQERNDGTATPLCLPTRLIVDLLSTGTMFEVVATLSYLDRLGDAATRDFDVLELRRATLDRLQRHHDASYQAAVSRTLSGADLQRADVTGRSSRVAAELGVAISEVGCAASTAEAHSALSRRLTTVVELIQSPDYSPTEFLACATQLFSPRIASQLLGCCESPTLAAPMARAMQIALHALELDGSFPCREHAIALLKAGCEHIDASLDDVVGAIPLLVQCLSDEPSRTVADQLVDLLRSVAANRLDIWDAIDSDVESVLNEDDGGMLLDALPSTRQYHNLLAVYRAFSGMELGTSTRGADDTPNLSLAIEVLTDGTRLEKRLALEYLRKRIAVMPATLALPVLLLDAVQVIFGLTLQGSEQNQAVATDVLAHLVRRDNTAANAVAQLRSETYASVRGTSSSSTLRSNKKARRASSVFDTDVEEDDGSDDAMSDGENEIEYLYSDSASSDELDRVNDNDVDSDGDGDMDGDSDTDRFDMRAKLGGVGSKVCASQPAPSS